MIIRPADASDVAAMHAIYAPIVRETAVSFDLEPPTLLVFEARIRTYAQGWSCLIAEEGGRLLGYAYGCSYRERRAYRFSTETSAYVHQSARGQGVGRALYEALLPMLADKGYCNAYAAIALPNPASVALHESVGFRPVGLFPAVGRKFGRWHDVGWYHRQLRVEPAQE